ncbi:MAG: HEPN domain-containing protein [Candidatus Falkowbacteria bacterium]
MILVFFFCHLTIEKLLKGLVVMEIQKTAPYIHDLEKLAILAKINATEEQIKNLKTISRFNMAGRYDDAKHNFYKIATRLYTKKYLDISNKLILCLKKQYQKK